MVQFKTCFVLIIIVRCSAQLNNGKKVSEQYLRTVVQHTAATLVCRQPSSEESGDNVRWFFSSMNQPAIKPITYDNRFKLTTENNNALLIRNVTVEDAGMYICCIDGPCIDIFLVVLEFKDILPFESDGDDASGKIIVSSKGDFIIIVHHGSEVMVDIFKEPIIPFCTHFAGNAMCYKKKHKSNTSFIIKNAKLYHSGWFEIQPSFMGKKGSFHLQIIIGGRPVVNMEKVPSDADADVDAITFICHGHAYPTPDVDIRFIPAHNDHSVLLDVHLKDSSNHSTSVTATAVIKQPIAGPGTMECRANNSEGIGYAVAPLLRENRDYQNRTIHHTLVNQFEFVIISPIGAPIVDGNVLLQCKASFYEFSKSFVYQYKRGRYLVDGSQQDDYWVANITLRPSGEELVICNAQFKNGSKISKQLILPLQLAVLDQIKREPDTVERFSMPQIMQWLNYIVTVVGMLGILGSSIILPVWIKISKLSDRNTHVFSERNPVHCPDPSPIYENPDYNIHQTSAAPSKNDYVEATNVQSRSVEVTYL